ncbi:MAG: signal recognition particle-docking protein FtsY [Frankia sp.]|nr:signal recognition particle-docking protein FtsY [Frankia sp.]
MEYVYLIIAIAVVLVVAAGTLVGTTLRRRRPSRQLPPTPPGLTGEGTRTTGATPPSPTGTVVAPPPPQPRTAEEVEAERRAAEAETEEAERAGAGAAGTLAPELEVPAPSVGRLVRLRARLARSQNALGRGLLSLLSGDELTEEDWEDVESTLLMADVGVTATTELVAALRERTAVLGARSLADVRTMLRDELLAQIGTTTDRSLRTSADGRPAVVLVVGVNGTGKTTTCGKIARLLIADGGSVVLGAADTFRAAAADQLETWGSRVGAVTVRGPEKGDPAAVAFDAVRRGIETGADTVLIDTAGRLHTKVGLMDELSKVKRVVTRQSPVDEVILVLDATTGQNALEQARVFRQAVDITGVALTKLDGTAKGGIVIAVQRELGVPVKLVGLGEGPDDLAPFDPEGFVDALLGDPVG